jgi:hypothetical protein
MSQERGMNTTEGKKNNDGIRNGARPYLVIHCGAPFWLHIFVTMTLIFNKKEVLGSNVPRCTYCAGTNQRYFKFAFELFTSHGKIRSE